MTTALPRELEIIKPPLVYVPAWQAAGHHAEELPRTVRVDPLHGPAFDVRAYPDLTRAACVDARRTAPNLHGVWTGYSLRVRRQDTHDLWSWLRRKRAYWSEAARRAAYWRDVQPEAIEEMRVIQNAMTDWWVLNMLLRTIGASGWATPATANHIILANGSPAVQIASLSGSTFTVIAGATWTGASFSAGQLLVFGMGSANQEILTVSGTPTSTSITTTTTPAHSHNAAEWIVLEALSTDNPSSMPTGYYDSNAITGTSSNNSNGFAYTGSGANGRQVQAVYNFPSNPSAPNSGYTDMYLANAAAASYVANSTASHATMPPVNAQTLPYTAVFTDTY